MMALPKVLVTAARCPQCGPVEDFAPVGYKRGPLPYRCTARILRRYSTICAMCGTPVLLETEPADA